MNQFSSLYRIIKLVESVAISIKDSEKKFLINGVMVLVIVLQIGYSCGTRFSTPPKRV